MLHSPSSFKQMPEKSIILSFFGDSGRRNRPIFLHPLSLHSEANEIPPHFPQVFSVNKILYYSRYFTSSVFLEQCIREIRGLIKYNKN